MRALALAIAALALAGCASSFAERAASVRDCPVTLSRQLPPDEVIEFIRAGVNPPVTFDQVRDDMRAHGNWYGRDGLWISLPSDGIVRWGSATWPSKLWTYSLVPGRASGDARRLDAPAGQEARAEFNGGAGGAGPGFIATAYLFPADGCWEAAYRVGDAELRFVVAVERD